MSGDGKVPDTALPPPYQNEPAYPMQQVHSQQPGVTPASGYYQQQPGVIVVTSPTVQVNVVTWGDVPMQTDCPNCHNTIVTSLTYEVGALAWLIVGGLFIVGFWLCCCIPCCINACKDVVHSCPSCNAVLGRCNRL